MASLRSLLRGRRAEAVPRVGYLVSGGGGRHPATAHIRVVSPMVRATASGAVQARQLDQVLFAHGGDPEQYDVVLAQRDVIEPDHVDAFLGECARRRVRLVLELDDDFVTEGARRRLVEHGYALTKLDALRRVLDRADAVIVSTAPLAEVLAPFGRPVAVVPNALDPAIWPHLGAAGTRPWGAADDELRMLYAGSATHAADLELLREPVGALGARLGRPVVLETIGVTPQDAGWHRGLPVPESALNYPDFAAWLRSFGDRWALGVAPLTDEGFNDAKSDLKFLEYTALGLPVVASARPPYRGIDALGARLVDDPAGWTDALEAALTEHPDARSARVARARRHVATDRAEPAGSAWYEAVTGRAAPPPA